MSPEQQVLDDRREIDEREQTVYILRVFHMLVDSREKILRIFRE